MASDNKLQNGLPLILIIAIGLAILTVVISSYIRLTDSGLGCTPWPSCYGQYLGNENSQGINVLMKEGESSNYRTERIFHRLIASSLGLVILFIFVLSWRPFYRNKLGRFVPSTLMLLTVVLAVIGPIRPNEPLPVLIVSNFVGGLIIVALIYYLYQKISKPKQISVSSLMLYYIYVGLFLVVLQIFWGGWTSANYAGISCQKVMFCDDTKQIEFSDAEVFNPMVSLKLDQHSKVVTENKMAIIQFIHHLFAVITLIYFFIIVALLMKRQKLSEKGLRKDCISILALLVFQFLLGMSTLVFALPIALVVLHNLFAALLFIAITSLYIKLSLRTSS